MGRNSLSQPKFNLESVQECGAEEAGHVQAKLNRNGWYLCCQLLPVIFMLYFFFLQDLLPFGKCIHHTPWQAIQKEQNVLDPRDEHVLSILCF